MSSADNFKVGARVHDSWWPWRAGKVIRVTKSRTRVRWADGEEWSYDSDHLVFLRVF
jgi:hypothetical protein